MSHLIGALAFALCTLIAPAAAWIPSVQNSQDKPVEKKSVGFTTGEARNRGAEPCAMRVTHVSTVDQFAVYPYRDAFSEMNCAPTQIDWKFAGTNASKLLNEALHKPTIDGSRMGTFPNAYVYIDQGHGRLSRLVVVMDWKFVMIEKEISKLYPLEKTGKILKEELLSSQLH